MIKPEIPKRHLLFVAAVVWTFAGTMLLFKGISVLIQYPDFLWVKITGCITAGILFYVCLFTKISLKHTQRIVNLEAGRPCFFSFFNAKSYLMMAMMISLGILLRKSGIISPAHLCLLHITMGIPLFMSAFRFYYFGVFYQKALQQLKQRE